MDEDILDLEKPIEVPSNLKMVDALQAAVRYVVVILGAFTTILALLKTHDIAALLDYIRSNDFTAVVAAVISLGTMLYGIFKTGKRGAQLTSVAADSRTPNSVARVVTK